MNFQNRTFLLARLWRPITSDGKSSICKSIWPKRLTKFHILWLSWKFHFSWFCRLIQMTFLKIRDILCSKISPYSESYMSLFTMPLWMHFVGIPRMCCRQGLNTNPLPIKPSWLPKHYTGIRFDVLSRVHSQTQVFFQWCAMSCSGSIQIQTLLLIGKMLIQSITRWPKESCVTSRKRSWCWTYSTHGAATLLEWCFDIDLSVRRVWPQKWERICDKAMNKKRFAIEYEFSFIY